MEFAQPLQKRSHNGFYIPCGDGPPGHKRPSYNYYCEFNFLPAPAGVFGGLFTVLVFVHIYLAIKYRSRTTCGVCTAAVLSAIAYWVKLSNAAAAPEMHELTVTWTVLSFVAVWFLNICLYTLLHRLRTTYLPATLIPSTPRPSRKILYSLFGVELLAIAVQIAGLALLFSWGFYYDGMENVHAILFFTGFILQLIAYFSFVAYLGLFHKDANKYRRSLKIYALRDSLRSSIEGGTPHPPPSSATSGQDYRPMVFALYTTAVLLSIRSIYYLINTSTGATFFPGLLHFPDYAYKSMYGLDKEWTFKFYEPGQFGLDAAPVFLALLVLAWPRGYAGRVLALRRRRGEDWGREGKRATVWDRKTGVEMEMELQGRRVEGEEHVANKPPPIKV